MNTQSPAYTITICMGSSCFSRGNSVNLDLLEAYVETHKLDVAIELVGSRCAGKCAQGPIISINETMYTQVDRGVLVDILEKTFGLACSK